MPESKMRGPWRAATAIGAAIAAAAWVAPLPPTVAQEADTVSVRDFFKGSVTRLTKDGEIELLYDFEDPAQLTDFEPRLPYRAIRSATETIERGELRVKGTGSFRHKAIFGERIESTATFTPLKPQNFGFAVTEERESEVFTLYCVQDRYFSLGDGVTTPQNMIIKFIPRDPKVNRDGFQDWRYCGSRGPKPEITRNAPVDLRITRGDNKSEMFLLDWKSGGKEWDRDLTSQMVAVFSHDSDIRVDNWKISGVLSPHFVARHKLDLSEEIGPAVKPEAAGEPEVDPAVAERIRGLVSGYPLTTKPPAMARLLRDVQVPESLRDEAAERVLASGNKAIVPFLVDGLYAGEVSARRTSFAALDGLVGRSFGFRPDDADDKRSKAIAKLNAYIQKNRKDFQ